MKKLSHDMKKRMLPFVMACLVILMWSASSLAHGLNVYAWLENDKIIVECNFGKDRPAKDAAVQILDSEYNNVLVKGKTDATGHFVFTVPQVVRDGHGLIVDVNAGEGHHNEWKMDASELYSAAALTAGFDEAALDAAARNKPGNSVPDHVHVRTVPQNAQNIPMPAGATPLSMEQAKTLINEALESKLGPIRHELAARNAAGPTMAEIIGGLGWIVGMAGIILYFRARRARKD